MVAYRSISAPDIDYPVRKPVRDRCAEGPAMALQRQGDVSLMWIATKVATMRQGSCSEGLVFEYLSLSPAARMPTLPRVTTPSLPGGSHITIRHGRDLRAVEYFAQWP